MTFSDLNLSKDLLTNLTKASFTIPTPIQAEAIPHIIAGENLVGVAHTGTGKTLAFTIPIIERLRHNLGVALVIVPTRELAYQMDSAIRQVSKGIPHMNPTVLVSDVDIDRQITSLKASPHIIVATPGRLNEHLDKRTFAVSKVTMVVIDEADHMLASGFAPQLERILDKTKKDRQTLMFSATMPSVALKLQERYAPGSTIVRIKQSLQDKELVTHEVCMIGATRRNALLTRMIHQREGQVMIFVASKAIAQRLFTALREAQLPVESLHGDRSTSARKDAIDGFRKGRYPVLIATDVAARGIDVPELALVVNYDFPRDGDTYIHRAGRTGRAGKKGAVVSFVTPADHNNIKRVEEQIGMTFPVREKDKAWM